MTRTTGLTLHQNAPGAHFGTERFDVAAEPELSRAAPWIPGRCYAPDCSRTFRPARAWQRYCSTACRKADEKERRAFGEAVAGAMLVWAEFERSTPGTDQHETLKAARRETMRALRGWRANRHQRTAAAIEQQEEQAHDRADPPDRRSTAAARHPDTAALRPAAADA